MSFKETFKNNPFKMISGAITLIITIVSSIFFIDGRYVHAGELTKLEQKLGGEIRAGRIQALRDKIFILNFKIKDGTATALDHAVKARLESKLQELIGK